MLYRIVCADVVWCWYTLTILQCKSITKSKKGCGLVSSCLKQWEEKVIKAHGHSLTHSPRMRQASFMSLDWRVTRLSWAAHRLASFRQLTR